jgi:hypothetical protein
MHPDAQATALYDALTLAIERADAMAGLLYERLLELDERPDAPSELYALCVVATQITNQHQLVLEQAQALGKLGGAK